MKYKPQKPKSHFFSMEKKIMKSLNIKYSTKEYQYSYISTNNLIFQQSSRIVAIFKDYLILDDPTEFLRRFYSKEESFPRLNKILTFFETYSKIFPNYMVLPESIYLYKNIRKKQKMIDAVNEIKREEEENRKQIGKIKKHPNINGGAVFTSKIQNSINRYQPSIAKNFDDSFENSISISIVSKKFIPSPANSFLKENETNISLINILSGMEPPKKSREITVKQKTKKNNYINNILETPQKQKKFIQKIISSTGGTLISDGNKSKSQKFISTNQSKTHTNASSSGHFNVYNNYQNIFIPQGNTVININNNFYGCNGNNNNNNNFSNVTSTNSNGNITHKIQEQIKLHGGVLSPQPSMRSSNMYKKTPKTQKSKKTFKSPLRKSGTNKNTLTERTKSSNIIKTVGCSTIFKRKNETVYAQKNNTLVARIERKNSNPKIQSRIHQNNLLNEQGYKSQAILGVNVVSPKKEDEKSKGKVLSTAMKTKYKAFLKKIKMNSLSNRNSCDSFITSHKSKKCFTRIFSSNSSTNNNINGNTNWNTISINKSKEHKSTGCKNFASQKNLSLKQQDIPVHRSAAFSPTHSTSSQIFSSFEPHTPITQKIKVNRKNYFEKLKGKNESNSTNKIDFQTYENNYKSTSNLCKSTNFSQKESKLFSK